MEKYDVTIGEYVQFLNAVAATDTYGLYNSYMAVDGYLGEYFPTVGITQSGSAGSYTYSVSYNASDWNSYATYNPSLYPSALAAAADCPVTCITWGDAARFCNWLQNGQPTNLGETAGSTETGAYTLNGDTTSYLEARNAGATYFLPTANEWYKAAFYKGGGTNAGYWAYETQNNSVPSNVLSVTGTNNANYGYADLVNYLTPVGAFAGSPGAYGTYDMGGDVWQWNQTPISGSYWMYGGAFDDYYGAMGPGVHIDVPPTECAAGLGFRVASVPEPSTITLLLASAACLLGCVWRRRRIRHLASALAVLLVLTAGITQAQVSNVFNMPNGEASLQFVTVGNPGNAADPSTGYGSASYAYQMGEYDVTVGQYVQFLNAVAKTDTRREPLAKWLPRRKLGRIRSMATPPY
jgi:formylglycine-generating enzyme required for sulfatase activity